MGSSTENSAFFKNPYDLDRVAGGSSGGSAVQSVAQWLFALGSDTVDNREPAALQCC